MVVCVCVLSLSCWCLLEHNELSYTNTHTHVHTFFFFHKPARTLIFVPIFILSNSFSTAHMEKYMNISNPRCKEKIYNGMNATEWNEEWNGTKRSTYNFYTHTHTSSHYIVLLFLCIPNCCFWCCWWWCLPHSYIFSHIYRSIVSILYDNMAWERNPPCPTNEQPTMLYFACLLHENVNTYFLSYI